MTAVASPPIVVRDATDQDMARVHAIYAYQVLHGVATFGVRPTSIQELLARRAAILKFGLRYFLSQISATKSWGIAMPVSIGHGPLIVAPLRSLSMSRTTFMLTQGSPMND
jgi:hypothetical protein